MIDRYIADFVCREKRWVIEIDGSQPIDAAEYDQQRTEHLSSTLAIFPEPFALRKGVSPVSKPWCIGFDSARILF